MVTVTLAVVTIFNGQRKEVEITESAKSFREAKQKIYKRLDTELQEIIFVDKYIKAVTYS